MAMHRRSLPYGRARYFGIMGIEQTVGFIIGLDFLRMDDDSGYAKGNNFNQCDPRFLIFLDAATLRSMTG